MNRESLQCKHKLSLKKKALQNTHHQNNHDHIVEKQRAQQIILWVSTSSWDGAGAAVNCQLRSACMSHRGPFC